MNKIFSLAYPKVKIFELKFTKKIIFFINYSFLYFPLSLLDYFLYYKWYFLLEKHTHKYFYNTKNALAFPSKTQSKLVLTK